MKETRQLAKFVTETRFEDLPAELLAQAKVLALDNIASGMVGSTQECSKIVADLVRESTCKEECTIFGQAWRTNPSGAALVNGTMIGAFETDHGYVAGSVHPGAAIFPALLAMAEREHKDGKSFLTAMVLGYEAICRIGEAATRAVEDKRGYHGPGTNAPFGAAIAVGKLLDFDEGTLTNAMGIAGSHSAGLLEFAWEGAMTKRIHIGRGSQMGLESAVLAGKGFTGPSTVLEGKYGFFMVFSPSPEPERLLADLGKHWVMKNMLIKPYACYGLHQSLVQALIDFMSNHPLDPNEIRRITVTATSKMVNKHDDKKPTTIGGAQYSLPFVIATALNKDVSNPFVFNEETLWNKDIRGLADSIEIVVKDQVSPGTPEAEITIETGAKRHIIKAIDFKGSPTRPFTFDDSCDKLRRYSVQIIGEERAENIINKVAKLEQLSDVSDLACLMQG